MKPRSIGYQIKQGIKNIGRNKMFSFASIATMTACIFIFGVFFSIIMNVNAIVRNLEQQVGITVLFDEGIDQTRIDEIGAEIQNLEHVNSISFTSAEEAWASFQEDYFAENPEVAESFAGDNPLANSASYTVLVDQIENQDAVAKAISEIANVRQVNQSSAAAKTLTSFNRLFSYGSITIVVILLVVSIILISNTINVGIAVRREEIAIMKLIGATDAFVRAPFIVEGLLLGLIGAALPLVILYFAYGWILSKLFEKFSIISSMSAVLPNTQMIFTYLIPAGLLLGIGIGLSGAFLTVRKHLEV